MGKIECCHGCAPPKRRPGCGATCIDYIIERSLLNIENEENFKRRQAANGVYEQRERQVTRAIKDKRRATQ